MMRKIAYSICLVAAAFLSIASWHDSVQSICVLFPQGGRDVFGVSQRNIIIVNDDEISLIPQVHFEGNSRDFGLMVPVPTRPELSLANSQVFTEASFMTQPFVRNAGQGCGCGDDNENIISPMNWQRLDACPNCSVFSSEKDGVSIVYEETVGTFNAVVLQATEASALTTWLNQNGYHYNVADSTVLSGYVRENWFFVAMKLDTAQVPQRIDDWWTATTAPAKITFPASGEDVIYPLRVSAISTKDQVEVLVYTISKKPMRFEGAKVEYSNKLNETELSAVASDYPAMHALLEPGYFLTKMRKNYRKSEMTEDFTIRPTDDDSEFREVIYTRQTAGTQFVGIIIFVLLLGNRHRFLQTRVKVKKGSV